MVGAVMTGEAPTLRPAVRGEADRGPDATVLSAILSAALSCCRAPVDARSHCARRFDHRRHPDRRSSNARVACRCHLDRGGRRPHSGTLRLRRPRKRRSCWSTNSPSSLATFSMRFQLRNLASYRSPYGLSWISSPGQTPPTDEPHFQPLVDDNLTMIISRRHTRPA